MAIFIEWDEAQSEFDHWDYVGGGVTEARYREVKVTRRARYSNTVSETMLSRARAYVVESRPGARVVIE